MTWEYQLDGVIESQCMRSLLYCLWLLVLAGEGQILVEDDISAISNRLTTLFGHIQYGSKSESVLKSVVKRKVGADRMNREQAFGKVEITHKSKDLARRTMKLRKKRAWSWRSVEKSRAVKEIFWIHIQKTSSWFGEFLVMWACPKIGQLYESRKFAWDHNTTVREYAYTQQIFTNTNLWNGSMLCRDDIALLPGRYGFGFHAPYRSFYHAYGTNEKVPINGSAAALFRRPLHRIISAYTMDFDRCPMLPLGFPGRSNRKKIKESLEKADVPVLAYATMPGIAHCQLKMVMGFHCGEPINMTREHLHEAKRRVRHDFVFVGLTEEPRATHDLFIAMFGGRSFGGTHEEAPPPYLLTLRRNLTVDNMTLKRRSMRTLAPLWRDELDEELYAEVADIFYSRCRQYGISTVERWRKWYLRDKDRTGLVQLGKIKAKMKSKIMSKMKSKTKSKMMSKTKGKRL